MYSIIFYSGVPRVKCYNFIYSNIRNKPIFLQNQDTIKSKPHS